MGFAEYAEYDATGLAELVGRRDVSPLELVEAAIARIEAANGALNAVVWTMFDRARAMAAGPLRDGPFTGVPFLLKDALGDLAGAPTRFGSALAPASPKPATADLTQRFLAAGLIPLGKTNVPEFALTPITESRLYGPARNPWDTSRTPGGSSGGSGAAVAAGMVPLAHANDGGGSIRIPAACCGLVGLKPTRARTSFGPELGEGWGGLEVEHVLTRSVRDCAAMLDAVAGGQAGDPYWAPPGPRSFLAESRKAPGVLRIAAVTQTPGGGAPHPDCVAAVEAAAALCRELGHEVALVAPPAAWSIFADLQTNPFIPLYAASLVTDIDAICAATGQAPSADTLEGYTLGLYELGRSLSASQYQAALNAMHRAGREIARWHEAYDVAVTPTVAAPPLAIGEVDLAAPDIGPAIAKLADFTPYTFIQNATGQPAISLPLHWNAAGLPIGVQFIGRFGEEATLLSLATQLEAATGWPRRRPPISA